MNVPDARSVVPILVGALVIWALYRRLRGSFGPQPVRPVRLRVRIVLLAVISVMLLGGVGRDSAALLTLLGGVACGAALAYIGLRHTRFEVTAQGRFYTPHTYMGLFVTTLLIARIVFRFRSGFAAAAAGPAGDPNPLHAVQSNRLTLAILGILLSYYLVYNIGLLWKSGREPLSAHSSIQQP